MNKMVAEHKDLYDLLEWLEVRSKGNYNYSNIHDELYDDLADLEGDSHPDILVSQFHRKYLKYIELMKEERR